MSGPLKNTTDKIYKGFCCKKIKPMSSQNLFTALEIFFHFVVLPTPLAELTELNAVIERIAWNASQGHVSI